MKLSAEQVEALAPDASSIAAGRKLAAPRSWQGVGRDERALWGECQGSKLYQTRIDLSDLVASCSCPSRKFPCKHALGLMFLAAGSPAAVPAASPPEWVTAWLERRAESAEKKAARAAGQATKQADPVARARRAAKRDDTIRDGLDRLDEWMKDVVRQGLARLQAEGPKPWEDQARRLIDAQAPGLSRRLRSVGAHVGTGPDWPARVLDGLGEIALLVRAYRRLDQLDEALRDDVRQQVGIAVPVDEVLARGERVHDRWVVIGQTIDDDERVRVQRSWLRGQATHRFGLVLQFAVGMAPFGESYPAGTTFTAELVFFPSASPQRCVVVERDPNASTEAPAAPDTIDALLERAADVASRVPWIDRTPAVVGAVRPVRIDAGRTAICDAVGVGVPLAGGDHRALFAVSGGHPIVLAGEWDGAALHPLGLFGPGGYTTLARRFDADAA